MKIKIVNVDMYGFCGRDLHPEKSDLGLVATVLSVKSESFIGSIPVNAQLCPEYATHEDYLVVVYYTAIMPDGSMREFVGHEIEVVSS